MRSRFVLAATVLSSAAVLAAGAVAAQTAAGQTAAPAASSAAAPAAPAPDAQAQMKAQMDAFAKLAMPGEHHKRLGSLVGKWKVTGKAWMMPGQPPTEMTSTMEASWILGGRFLQEVHTGNFMGQPFEGRSLDGYDNVAHEYVAIWADNMGTGVEIYRGSCDDPCKVLTETAEGLDPMTGKMMKTKSVTTFVDDDTYRMDMYVVGPGGQDVKMMEFAAKRER
jgi:hypothetical protein